MNNSINIAITEKLLVLQIKIFELDLQHNNFIHKIVYRKWEVGVI